MKTNAVRILEGLGISYEVRSYDVDVADLTAETVARKIGLPPEQVFKTLVARGERTGVLLAVVPGKRRSTRRTWRASPATARSRPCRSRRSSR
jgi:prolyl-tRNA editing enzyme YbaK/EbsC (Cys-tRNA(Pro) deacylase)